MNRKQIIAAIVTIAMSLTTYAHGGGKDPFGCHTDHKTGVYHCH